MYYGPFAWNKECIYLVSNELTITLKIELLETIIE